MTVPGMTLAARRDRREQAALRVKEGSTIEATARAFGITRQVVYNSCAEFDVALPGRTRKVRTFKILADLLQTRETMRVLATRHAVSWQRVDQVLQLARAGGIRFPHRQDRTDKEQRER